MKIHIPTFATNLRNARIAAHLSQTDLAALLHWRQSRIAHYELCTREPYLADIELLAQKLKITPHELAFGRAHSIESLSACERELLRAWRSADKKSRRALLAMCATITGHNKPRAKLSR